MQVAVRRAAVLAGLLLALVGVTPSAAFAHQPRPTLITVSTGSDPTHPTLVLAAEVPLDKLRLAYGLRIAGDPTQGVEDQAATIADLVATRVSLTSNQGAWAVQVDSVRASTVEGRDTARVQLTASAPSGALVSRVDLRWQLITDVVFSHKVYVAGTDTDGSSALVGVITAQQPTVPLEVATAAAPSSRSMLSAGFEHFREGIDHQLFLCLVALAVARRRAGVRPTVRRLAALTVMFTIGHSVSLALASSGLVTIASRWVETGIAVTILLAAVHAIQPVLPMRVELAVTAAFGLIHGFGFAGTLADLSLDRRALVVPVLTFNVGLELAQLLALALFVIPLWVVARSVAATTLLAGTVAAVAASWIIQRSLDLPNPIDAVLADVVTTPEWLALLLTLPAAAVLVGAGIATRARQSAASS